MHLLLVALKYVSLEYEFNARVICEESEAIFANLRRLRRLEHYLLDALSRKCLRYKQLAF